MALDVFVIVKHCFLLNTDEVAGWGVVDSPRLIMCSPVSWLLFIHLAALACQGFTFSESSLKKIEVNGRYKGSNSVGNPHENDSLEKRKTPGSFEETLPCYVHVSLYVYVTCLVVFTGHG